jgi:predicted NodU family carbamoyl transferase
MANLAAAYWGHDSSICLYNDQTRTFHIIEIEKLTGIKHYRGHARKEEQREILETVLEISEKTLGMKNDYDAFIIGSFAGHEDYCRDDNLSLDPEIVQSIFNVRNIEMHKRHHRAHAWGAYAQSPWVGKSCTALTFDAGGDDGHTHMWDCQPWVLTPMKCGNYDRDEAPQPWPYYFGRNYNLAAGLGCQNMVSKTDSTLDMAGKVMGMSAYGNRDSYHAFLGRGLINEDEETTNMVNPAWIWYRSVYSLSSSNMASDGVMRTGKENVNGKEWIAENQNETPEEVNHYNLFVSPFQSTWEEECDIAAGIQHQHEENVLQYLQEPEVWDKICRNGKRLVLSGGCALNILTNTRIQEELGLEVFVPPDVTDSGLPFGMICTYMSIHNRQDFIGADIRYAGLPISDMHEMFSYRNKFSSAIISIDQLVGLLKEDKILGLVQGNAEVGPRALGNRSIICDPKGVDKKDKVNLVKRRESYRPFAPMVRQEDAHIYFDAGSYDNLEYMNFSVKVREEYKEQLAAVTHVDGSARVQSVTRKSNAFLYDLLGASGGVLLNTSFNVKGKPILNTLKEAFQVLEETVLDGLVVYNNGKLCYFSTEVL